MAELASLDLDTCLNGSELVAEFSCVPLADRRPHFRQLSTQLLGELATKVTIGT